MRFLLHDLAAASVLILGTASAGAQPVVSKETLPAPVQPAAIDLPIAMKTPPRDIWHLDGTQVNMRSVIRPALTPIQPVDGYLLGLVESRRTKISLPSSIISLRAATASASASPECQPEVGPRNSSSGWKPWASCQEPSNV